MVTNGIPTEGRHVNVIIGLHHASRDLALALDLTAEEFEAQVRTALAEEGAALSLADSKGDRFTIPGRAIAWVQVTSERPHRVGFAL